MTEKIYNTVAKKKDTLNETFYILDRKRNVSPFV